VAEHIPEEVETVARRAKTNTLTTYSLVVSLIFSCALFLAFSIYGSDLALAQAADSLLDVLGAIVLAWSVRVAAAPRDERHPMGHSRAEPLGALAIAFVSAALALEVGSTAVSSLTSGVELSPGWGLLALFSTKSLAKLVLLRLASKGRGPAVEALIVDARNDVIVGIGSVAGFFFARAGYHLVDPLLALPIAIWIGWSGFSLAKENIDLLMGVAPPLERQRELLAIAQSIPGVQNAHDLLAQHLGTELSLHVHVEVPGDLTVSEGHDIGELVRLRLLEESDVAHCSIHIDPSERRKDGSR
jgi:ferrous-iron efflux pump FieF